METGDFGAILVCIIVVAGGIAWATLQPHFESQAYNRLTGATTTYWDAVFLELRVQESTKKANP